MFCLTCGEAIPDGSIICPLCGAKLQEKGDEQAIVYASQKVAVVEETLKSNRVDKKKFLLWCAFAVISFVGLALNYFSISINVYTSSDSSYTGYSLLKCLQGTVGISGYMVIILIITNIAVLITGIIGTRENALNAKILRAIMIMESIAYLIAAIVPYFNIKKALAEFDPEYTTTSIGVGCYVNIVLAIIAVVYYFFSINKQLKNK